MDRLNILTEADITTPRSPRELVAWATHKNNQLSATAEAKLYTWSGAILPNKFKKEIWPLALFVAKEFAETPNTLITPNLGNENFDATVAFGDGRPNVLIEITQEIDGYDLALRIEAVLANSFVPLTGPISRGGRRGAPDSVVVATLLMEDDSDRLAKHLKLVEDAVQRKAGRQYGENCNLLVVVDDYLGFPDDFSQEKLNELVTSKLLLPELDFMHLFIFGRSGNLARKYQLPRYSRAMCE